MEGNEIPSIWGLFIPLITILIIAIGVGIAIGRLLGKPSPWIAWARRFREARSFTEPPKVAQESFNSCAKSYWFPLPYALIAAIILNLTPCLYIFGNQVNIDTFFLLNFVGHNLLAIAGLAFIAYSFYVHFKPNVPRKKKYEYLVSGVAALGTVSLLPTIIKLDPREAYLMLSGISPKDFTSPMFLTMLFLLMKESIALLAVGFIMLRWMRPWLIKPGMIPSRSILRVHRIVRTIGIAVFGIGATIAIFAHWPSYPFLVAYLVARYILIERLSLTPIIYLRSFSYSEGPASFGRIVNKVASRYGVITSIVHPIQKGSDLHDSSAVTEQASVSIVRDDRWQKWVELQLKWCTAVIIDRSIETSSITWEINKSKEIVDPSRIAILQKKKTLGDPIPGTWALEYEIGKKSEKEARKALNLWFEKAFSL